MAILLREAQSITEDIVNSIERNLLLQKIYLLQYAWLTTNDILDEAPVNDYAIDELSRIGFDGSKIDITLINPRHYKSFSALVFRQRNSALKVSCHDGVERTYFSLNLYTMEVDHFEKLNSQGEKTMFWLRESDEYRNSPDEVILQKANTILAKFVNAPKLR